MGTVLIIDDSNFMRTLIKNIVKKQGLTVVGEAENGEIGTAKYKELAPDIVTLDLVMDEKDGLATLEHIIDHNPEAVVIMLSSMLGQKYFADKAKSLGAKEILTKPIDTQKFNALLRKYTKHLHTGEPSQPGTDDLAEEEWRQLLEVFRRDAEKVITTLRETIKSGDLKLFTTSIHAIKSALANIDEFEVSDMAYLLEMAAKNGNTGYISDNTESFIAALEQVVKSQI